jgi:hypothetical protein
MIGTTPLRFLHTTIRVGFPHGQLQVRTAHARHCGCRVGAGGRRADPLRPPELKAVVHNVVQHH